jgi:ankyrin repeat protein
MGNTMGGPGPHGAFLDAVRSNDAQYVVDTVSACGLKILFSAQTWQGRTIFHVAASAGHHHLLPAVVQAVTAGYPGCRHERVLSKHGDSAQAVVWALANDRDGKSMTPLHVAAIHGREESVRYLLRLGADPWLQVRP